MKHRILLAQQAVRDLRRLRAHDQAAVRAAIEKHLRHQPKRTSRSRIKRLRGLKKPEYRLRVGDTRVFYDVAGDEVYILAIISKPDSEKWLAE
ncbi:MAG: type II toxin-antitoxin system RelE/ParE family toxin [Candidatus Krumholzibacteria bacterium]|nr:type II toxin-antitoxin system RelE/ParE family toxin [Candidatus Krumholzibacteria bacterium]